MAGRGGRIHVQGFNELLATAMVVIGAPGSQDLGFTRFMAGRGGRSDGLGFTSFMATAVAEKGAPGKNNLGFVP
jgi:hypothetical protein